MIEKLPGRILSRKLARELELDEIDQVAGGWWRVSDTGPSGSGDDLQAY